jgi:cobyrinic acid a,c-diamide synthase
LPEEKAEVERPGAELRPSADREKSAEPAVAASDLQSAYPTLLCLGEGTGGSRRRRVAVALDRAFHFYYPDDWEAFATLGVELAPFDTLSDARLPSRCDALWLGGGFPEMAAAALAENQRLRREIAAAARDGFPIYAECGGLIYLSERLIGFDGRAHPMCGVLPAEVAMEAKAVGRGYVHLVATADHPWPVLPPVVRAHEFHHSRLHWLDTSPPRFAWTVKRGFGIDGDHDGVVWYNVLAGYAHLRSLATWSWVAAWCATWSDTSPAARAVPLIEEVV